MNHILSYKLFEAEYTSSLAVGDLVSFLPMERHCEQYGISKERGFGRVIAVRFTTAKVLYDIVDDYYGYMFDDVDSAYVEKSEARENLEK